MKLTEAQRKTIATMDSMSNEAGQCVGEPQPFGTSLLIEFCIGWYTQEVVIHPDGSIEVHDERLA